MKPALPFALVLAAASGAGAVPPVEPASAPPKAVARPVTDDYYGTKIVDLYRYMESKDAETIAWMKAQGSYSRALFDSIGPRKAFLERMSAFVSGFGFVGATQPAGDRVFYLQRAPGSDVYSLMVGRGAERRLLVDTAALIRAAGGTPHAIDYFTASPDGSKVAVGISTGGSEDSRLSIIDTASGRTLAGPLDRAQFSGIAWLPDSSGLFLSRRQADPAPALKYKKVSVQYWDLRGDPVPVAGAGTGRGPIDNEDIFPFLGLASDSPVATLIGVNGVQNEIDLWWGDRDQAAKGAGAWRPLATRADGIVQTTANRSTLFMKSHKDAPTFKILAVPLGGALADAKTVLPANPDRLIENIAAASDGLYVAVREGLWSKLLHVGNDGRVRALALPFKGSIGTVAADPDAPGVIVSLEGWTRSPTNFRYDPGSDRFADLGLDIAPAYDPARYEVAELKAKAKDGTMVPLTVIVPAGPRKPRPVILDAYGAYGISNFPYFQPRFLPFADAGGGRAECSVRGGGEYGEAWRLAGKGPTKPNTWGDFIACAEKLIADGYTTPDMLTIMGTSAGGIAVGRTATDRPDLFAGAVARVGDVNALRMETMPAGPANIPEFGTVKTEQGFRDLYAMDTIQHVRDGVRYPAFLITGGLNDPRVEPWQGAKLTARLQEMPGHRPALFRLEESAGHGLGTTKAVRDAEEADIAAFAFWRAGVPEWQPGTGKP
jgi:prolyl oligopeptidase